MEANKKSKSSIYWHEDVLVISGDTDRMKELFEKLGLSFVKEKHGDGPEHWVATKGGHALELYPKTYKQVEVNKINAEKKENDVKKATEFKVPPHLNRQFLYDIANGITFCCRKYNASREQVIAEIKRLAPGRSIGVLKE